MKSPAEIYAASPTPWRARVLARQGFSFDHGARIVDQQSCRYFFTHFLFKQTPRVVEPGRTVDRVVRVASDHMNQIFLHERPSTVLRLFPEAIGQGLSRNLNQTPHGHPVRQAVKVLP